MREPWIYALLAVLYVVLVAGALGPFVTTASVAAFVATDRGVTIGWVHWLVFDAFVDRWMTLDARERGVPHLADVPSLLLTLFAGPTGLLTYLITRTLLSGRAGRRRTGSDQATTA